MLVSVSERCSHQQRAVSSVCVLSGENPAALVHSGTREGWQDFSLRPLLSQDVTNTAFPSAADVAHPVPGFLAGLSAFPLESVVSNRCEQSFELSRTCPVF